MLHISITLYLSSECIELVLITQVVKYSASSNLLIHFQPTSLRSIWFEIIFHSVYKLQHNRYLKERYKEHTFFIILFHLICLDAPREFDDGKFPKYISLIVVESIFIAICLIFKWKYSVSKRDYCCKKRQISTIYSYCQRWVLLIGHIKQIIAHYRCFCVWTISHVMFCHIAVGKVSKFRWLDEEKIKSVLMSQASECKKCCFINFISCNTLLINNSH